MCSRIDKTVMTACSQPKAIKKLRHFLGLSGYYGRYVPKFLDPTSPLIYPTKKTFGPSPTNGSKYSFVFQHVSPRVRVHYRPGWNSRVLLWTIPLPVPQILGGSQGSSCVWYLLQGRCLGPINNAGRRRDRGSLPVQVFYEELGGLLTG